MRKYILSWIALICLSCVGSSNFLVYSASPNPIQEIILNGEVMNPPFEIIRVNDELLVPLRWFANAMGASSVNWNHKEQTVTVVVDDFRKSRQYLSYLSGLESASEDYPLAKRLQHLKLPPYPLHSQNPIMIHKSPINLTITSGEMTMPWAIYDYTFINGTLYVGTDWLNILFLAQIENSPTTLSIIYPTANELTQSIAEFESLTTPRSPEEAIALWIHGQQYRNGALQYSALSPKLKEQALSHTSTQGWVTGGSTPSLEEATITSNFPIDDNTFIYEIEVRERTAPNEYSQIHQTITIQKYTINNADYWLINNVTGDLDYYTVLPSTSSFHGNI